MWKLTFAAATLIGAAVPAIATPRYDTASHSCAAIQSFVAGNRQAILRYPSHDGRMTLYDRYVSQSAQCGPGLYGVRAYVPSADGSCPVMNCHSTSELAP